MSRPIKFRAWDSLAKKMRYLENADEHWRLDLISSETAGMSWELCRRTEGVFWNVVDSLSGTLMQYTGLKDNNGVEIYEGDVVELDLEGLVRMKVMYFQSCFMLFHKGMWLYSLYTYQKSLEVIGNIYENPELIEK